VWTPGDPAGDAAFSPPASQIDAVALTMAEFPKTTWANPAVQLAAAAKEHPGKPLLLQVAADGPGPQRAAWLDELAAAVGARTDVAAVVYQEAGPVDDLSGADAKPWAVTADPQTLAAFRLLAAAMAKVDNP
jgi:hypothetical protein